MPRKPLIALSVGYTLDEHGRGRVAVFSTYPNAVRAAGGLPVMVPPVESAAAAVELLERVDGLLMIGGPDIDPAAFAPPEPTHPAAELMRPERQSSDFALLAAADAAELPILGICLGFQELNVARGGSLHQHLPDVPGVRLEHTSKSGPIRNRHDVCVQPGSRLHAILASERLVVNSSHHQGLTQLSQIGRGLLPTAWSEDGVIEGLEATDASRFVLAVQWHPEDLLFTEPGREDMRRLFAAFASACAVRANRA